MNKQPSTNPTNNLSTLLKDQHFTCDRCGSVFDSTQQNATIQMLHEPNPLCATCTQEDFEFRAKEFVAERLASELGAKIVPPLFD